MPANNSAKTDQLVFIYNADSGLFNTMTDIAHKVFSPKTYQCSLCMITHGSFSMRNQWKEFIKSLPCPIEYLHKDEFRQDDYLKNEVQSLDFPLILSRSGDQYSIFLNAGSIDACQDIDELIELIRSRLL